MSNVFRPVTQRPAAPQPVPQPPVQQVAPRLEDVDIEATDDFEKLKRQRGRAATVLRTTEDNGAGATARRMLGGS